MSLLALIPRITVLHVLLAAGFVAGVASIPLLAYTIGPSLPGFLVEPVTSLLLMLGFAGPGQRLLTYTEDQFYEIRHVDNDELEDVGPRRWWSKLSISTFGVGYEKSRSIFGHIAKDVDFDSYTRELAGKKMERPGGSSGGVGAFVDCSRAARNADIHVPTSEKLSELQGSADIESTQEAEVAAMQEEGGDTGGHSPRVRLYGAIIFALMGTIMGWVVFF